MSTSFDELRPHLEKILGAKFIRIGKVGNAFHLAAKGKTEENLRKFLGVEALMKKVGVDHNWLSATEHGVGCTFKNGQEHMIVNFIDDQMFISLVF